MHTREDSTLQLECLKRLRPFCFQMFCLGKPEDGAIYARVAFDAHGALIKYSAGQRTSVQF